MSGQLKVTLIKSVIGTLESQRGTIRALGLHKTGSVRLVPDRPEIRGMLGSVSHLVTVEPDDGPSKGGGRK